MFAVPVAASTTVAPAIGLLLASRTVTVIVLVAAPAMIDAGAASTIDCAAEIGLGTTVTVAVCVTASPPIVAVTVFVCATVEAIVPVATPLAFVTPTGCTSVLPVPVALRITVAPTIGFPLPSRAVTVIVLVALPAAMLTGETATVESPADGESGITVTVAVCVMATPPAVAETVFASATVEASVPVATPLALVTATGCTSELPVPVAPNTTAAPGITLPFTSRAVTVMVVLGPPAEMEPGEAVRVDVPAETVPGLTVTMAVLVIARPAAVAEIVFDSATVELNAPVATPAASVTVPGCVIEFPVPDAASKTAAPGTTLLKASRAVTVTIVAAAPAMSVDGEAATVEVVAETAAGVTVTVAVCVMPTPPIVADTAFDCATVEAIVPVATPLAFVTANG